MKKLLIVLVIVLLLCNIVYGDFERTVLNETHCEGVLLARMYGNTSCYLKGCRIDDSKDKNVWICNCAPKLTTITVATPVREKCSMTVQYFQVNDKKVIFPFETEWAEEVNEAKSFSFNWSPTASLILFIVGIIIVIVLLILFITYIIKYIKKEVEEDEKRNQ